MSDVARSCTCEARSVSVPAPLYIGSAFRLRFNVSIYGRALQPFHVLEARFNASIYNMTNKKRNENFFYIKFIST